jgi:tetratricopeptide (TPR) repeat protein
MTNYNLAIAYEKNSDSEKAIALFEEILKSKAYPNGVTEMGLKKNLAITLESQADEYATQAEKLIEQKKASDASALTQQAIDNLEKSKAIFESLKQSDEIKSHLDGLNQQIEKLKNPS